ncbi:MAG: 3-oxoacyl-ACP reductase FabG [Dehalococcoidia bacterium]|jgi:3-oxoacyl-(acyl-carrier-protein) reductase|nr:3-oxoacyl-ACP reductase FabG [Dehalococcoidia bacterium]MDW8009333.1 3-oxoacyl-ACP reductase family protein [Chloroflexota bacterium]
MGSLSGKVAIVTGSSRGLGAAIVKELALHGAKVTINYFHSKDQAEQLRRELEDQGCEAICVQADVSQPEQAQHLVQCTVQHFGGLDILVNNAGINRDRTIRRMSLEEWREVIATDLDSVFYCTYYAVPHMIERGGGRILNMSSIVGEMGNIGQANYAAAKAGIVGFTKAAALELARFNITVNAVCPGFIETDMVTSLSEEVQKNLLARIPMGRFGRPEEVARLCRFLVAEGDYITGAAFDINGGMYLR